MKSKWLALILVIIAAISGVALLFAPKKGTNATIYKDGELFCTVALTGVKEPYTIQVGEGNVVRVEEGRICMESADCPDKLCVKQGWSSTTTKPIVCLPNKVIIVVSGDIGGGLDAVTG